jgi:hypothetical protein
MRFYSSNTRKKENSKREKNEKQRAKIRVEKNIINKIK